jgi:AraC family transcriptional regulator
MLKCVPSPMPFELRGRVATLGDLTLESVFIPSLFEFRRHGHEESHFCFIVGGSFEELYNGKWRDCRAGSARRSPSGAEHTIKFGQKGARCLLILASPEAMTDSRVENDLVYSDLSYGTSQTVRTTFDLVSSTVSVNPLDAECLGWELIAQLGRKPERNIRGPAPSWLQRAREQLREEYRNSLTLASVAKGAGVSREHLARAFRFHFGMSPSSFVQSAMLHDACQQITETEIPLAEVAAQCGYADQSHMCRWVSRKKGVSPISLRKAGHITYVQDLAHVPQG